jgi:hypothetical protein
MGGDPLVSVSVHLRKHQLALLDQRADAEHTSRAELVREAIDLLLTGSVSPWKYFNIYLFLKLYDVWNREEISAPTTQGDVSCEYHTG